MTLDKNPFPGLRPFKSDETHLFFGRERHVSEVLRKLETYRFVAVVGNSGSGKSSLVRAGILPKLKLGQNIDADWLISVMRPGENPIQGLINAIGESINDPSFTTNTEHYKILNQNKLGLIQLLRPILNKGKRLLILVDQFEELFRFKNLQSDAGEKDKSAHFVDLILEAVNQNDVAIYAMLTLRSDFLGDCEQFMGLPEAINNGQFLVPRMNRIELQSSLTGPIQYSGGKISPRLSQQLLNEIGNNPDQLPIMQHVLMRTWEVWEKLQKPGQPLDLEHYEKTGGMARALSNHAEEAFALLKTEREQVLAKILFKSITLKGSDNRGVRRPTNLSTIARIARASSEEIIDVASVFRHVDQGFIMPPSEIALNDDSILDISHESLMRVWQRLSAWVEEEAESAELYERITESAMLYEQGKAGLWRDPDLQIALDWRKNQNPNQDWASQYNNFYNTSIRFIEASLNEKKFQLAETQRRKKIINATAVMVLAALSVLSVWALTERNNSAAYAQSAIEEKAEAEKLKKVAEEQRNLAQVNYLEARAGEKRVQEQQLETEEQRKLALLRAEEARLAKTAAEGESVKAIAAKKTAENERLIAQKQKVISDSLRYKSEKSEKNAARLRILALAQNLAIKSKVADQNAYTQQVKALLAVQAYNFNKRYQGDPLNPDIFGALFSAMRIFQSPTDYVHRIHKDAVKSVCYDPSGNLASAGDDGKIITVPSNNPSKFSISSTQALIFDNLVYSDKGDRIAISADDNSVQIFAASDISTPQIRLEKLHPAKIIALEWYGEKLITACLDNHIRVIDPSSKKVLKIIPTESKPFAIDLNTSSGLLALGCENGAVYKMHIERDNSFKLLKKISETQINCVSINDNASLLATGSSTGTCYVLNFNDGTIKSSLSGHRAGISHVRFQKGTNYLATACYDWKVRLFTSLESGTQPIIFNEHDNWVLDVIFHPNGREIASCGKDKTVRMYPISSEDIAAYLLKNINTNLTLEEWKQYVGLDVEYEKTKATLP